MNIKNTDYVALGLGAIALGLAIWLATSISKVRNLNEDVMKLNAQLARNNTLAQVNNNLIQLMASTAAEKNDAQLRGLLQANGVTFKVAPAATPATGGKSAAE